MLRPPTWTTGFAVTAALALATLGAAAPAAQAQQITTTDLPALQTMVDAEVAKAPAHDDSQVWGLFKQLEALTVQGYTNDQGVAVPPGPHHDNPDANYYCAKIGFFLLKNVAGNPDMFGGWVWPRTQERITWALTQNGNHPQAWLLWGHIHRDRIAGENWAEAERGYGFDLKLNPTRFESKRYHVYCLLRLGKAAEALTTADAYLADHADSAPLHEMRGDALYSLGTKAAPGPWQTAMQAYQAAAELDLADGGLLDKVKKADLLYQDATTGAPQPHAFLQWLQGYGQRHPEQSISEEKRGVELRTIWVRESNRVGLAGASAWATQTVQCFEGLEARFPESPRVAVWCAELAEVHRWYLALPELESAVLRGLRADPSNQDIMGKLILPSGLNLFDHYKSAQRYADGIAIVNQLLPLLPADAPQQRARRAVMHQFAFECHKGLGQFPLAFAAIQAAIQADPRNAVYPNSYGLLLRVSGDTAAAMAQFRAALEIAPSHPWAAQNLATLLMAQQQWKAFHDHCSRALYWGQDAVEQAKAGLEETRDPQRADGPASQDQVAAAQEALDAAVHDLLKMRRLWTEGLQLERAATAHGTK